MSKQTEALKLALEAICGSGDFLFNWHDCEPNNEREIQRYQATLADNEKAFTAIREALAEQPAQHKPLTDEECDRIYTALDQWAREFDQYEFGLPTHCGDGMIGGRAIIRAAHGIKENT